MKLKIANGSTAELDQYIFTVDVIADFATKAEYFAFLSQLSDEHLARVQVMEGDKVLVDMVRATLRSTSSYENPQGRISGYFTFTAEAVGKTDADGEEYVEAAKILLGEE